MFEGTHAPSPAEIEIESVVSTFELSYMEEGESSGSTNRRIDGVTTQQMSEEEIKRALDEVERQQTDFGVKHQNR